MSILILNYFELIQIIPSQVICLSDSSYHHIIICLDLHRGFQPTINRLT